MVIKNNTKIKKWAEELSLDQLETAVLVISSFFDFAKPSYDEDEKQIIELNAFTSKLVSVKDAFYWAQEISKLLKVEPFLVREIPAVISSIPYHNSGSNEIYTRITKEFFVELRDLYCILKDVKSKKEKAISLERTIILSSTPAGDKIYLASDAVRCYPFKRNSSQRFDIVKRLHSKGSSQTIKDLAEFLEKDSENKEVQGNLRTTIKKINKIFKLRVGVDEDLIVIDKLGGKNIYYLNEESFKFKLKK